MIIFLRVTDMDLGSEKSIKCTRKKIERLKRFNWKYNLCYFLLWNINVFIHWAIYRWPKSVILREAPKLRPDWLAPRFVPACNPIIASEARNWSSLKSRRFSSASRGPRRGPLDKIWKYAYKRNSSIHFEWKKIF